MIEFKGWLTIDSGNDELNIFESTRELMRKSEALITAYKKYNQFCELREINGFITLFIGGGYNHDNGYSEDLLQLLKDLCQIAPESYGIIHVRWPEHEEIWNQYKIYRVAKGTVTILDDIYLSPCKPTIED